jgi:uncharacterized protein (DUF1800 family)
VATLDDGAAVRRLLDRFGFGPRPGELASAKAAGFRATVAALLDPAAPAHDTGAVATPPPNLGAAVLRPGAAAKQQDPAAKKQAQRAIAAQELTLAGWWLDRMVATEAPFVERMTWFWHGHFATSEQKVRSPQLMQRQNETFRQQGTGSLITLAKSMIVDPAMMVWLDAQQNSVRAPNENLAREAMELFLLGIGHYTEDDVRAAARALTGWTVDRATGTTRLVPRRHDNKSKTILGATQNFDADSFVELVLSQAASPRFVAGRIWYRLVSTTPPQADVLDRLVAGYGPNRDVHGLLTALAAEPAFVDTAQTMVKQPVEWLVGLLRAVGVKPGQLPPTAVHTVVNGLRALGQVPFEPPNVGGWPADVAWLTTSAALTRLRLAGALAARVDLTSVSAASSAARPEAVRVLLGVDAWSDRTKAALAKVADDARQLFAIAACAPEYIVSQ